MTTRSTTTHGAATGKVSARYTHRTVFRCADCGAVIGFCLCAVRQREAIEAEAVTLDDPCPLTLCVNRGVPDHDLHII